MVYGDGRQQVIDRFRFIDWVLQLPKALDQQWGAEIMEFEESRKMPYISSVERLGEERGRLMGIRIALQEGREKGKAGRIRHLLTRRFRAVPTPLPQRIAQADSRLLDRWGDRILDATSLEEMFPPETPDAVHEIGRRNARGR